MLQTSMHSPIGGWNVENLHYNRVVTRQLVGHHLAEMKVKSSVKTSSTIVYFGEAYGSLV